MSDDAHDWTLQTVDDHVGYWQCTNCGIAYKGKQIQRTAGVYNTVIDQPTIDEPCDA